jgi:hypothetical protein
VSPHTLRHAPLSRFSKRCQKVFLDIYENTLVNRYFLFLDFTYELFFKERSNIYSVCRA